MLARPPETCRGAHPAYAELHCHSHVSFLDGASAPDDLVARAVELGLGGLAVTDHQGLYGAVRLACRPCAKISFDRRPCGLCLFARLDNRIVSGLRGNRTESRPY